MSEIDEILCCDICRRSIDQLKPFEKSDDSRDDFPIDPVDPPNDFLMRGYRNFMEQLGASWECKDCFGVPVRPWEVYGELDIFLLFHYLDSNSWETPVFNWEDKRLDRLLISDHELNKKDDGFPEYLLDIPAYNYIMRPLRPHEVEKIKAAPGNTIIVVPKREVIGSSGHKYYEICEPPEVIENDKTSE